MMILALVDAAHRELEIAAVAVGRSSTCAAGQERRAPLYGLLLPKMFHAPSSGRFRSSTHRKFAARWHA